MHAVAKHYSNVCLIAFWILHHGSNIVVLTHVFFCSWLNSSAELATKLKEILTNDTSVSVQSRKMKHSLPLFWYHKYTDAISLKPFDNSRKTVINQHVISIIIIITILMSMPRRVVTRIFFTAICRHRSQDRCKNAFLRVFFSPEKGMHIKNLWDKSSKCVLTSTIFQILRQS